MGNHISENTILKYPSQFHVELDNVSILDTQCGINWITKSDDPSHTYAAVISILY
jgi:hypothetical protein